MDRERPTLYLPDSALIARAMRPAPTPATSVELVPEREDAPLSRRELRQFARLVKSLNGGNSNDSRAARPRFPNGKFFDAMSQLHVAANPARASRKPVNTLAFPALRMLGRWSIIDRLIINARKAQARRFARICDVPGKQLGFRVVHRRYQDPEFDSDTDDIRKRCAEMEEVLRHPSYPPHQNFGDWLENAIEEELVIDRKCLVLPKSRRGRVRSYHLVDGATVMPRIEAIGRWMIANRVEEPDPEVAARKMQAQLWMQPPLDQAGRPYQVNLLDAEYVQMIDERVVEAWEEDQMVVSIAHPTVEWDQWGYGRSMLEDSYSLSLLFLDALRYNKNLFDTHFPEAILVIGGTEMDEEGTESFRERYLDFDPNEASTRMPVVSAGPDGQAQLLRLRDSLREMAFPELLRMIANLKCAAYRMHPSTINVTPEGQGGAVVSMDSSQGEEIGQATEEGFHSLMQGLADLLTHAIVAPVYDDLIVIVEGLDRENEQAFISRMEFEMQFSSMNEMRANLNKKPLPKGLPVEIGDFVAGEAWMQAYQAIQGAQQAQQQQDMGQYEAGDFGQGPGQPGGGQDQGGQGQPGQPGQPWPSPVAGQGTPQSVQPGGQPGQPSDPAGATQAGWQAGNQRTAPFQRSQGFDGTSILITVDGSVEELLAQEEEV